MSAETDRSLGFLKRHAKALVASLAVAAGLFVVLRRGALPLWPPPGVLDHIDWLEVGWFELSLIVAVVIRAVRVHYLIEPIAHVALRKIFAISGIAIGLVTFLPFRLGEVARPALLREKGKLSGWAVTGTVGAERIIDGVVFSSVLFLGLVFAHPHEPLPDRIGNLPVPASLVPRAAQLATAFFGLSFVVMAGFFFFRTLARKITGRVVGLVSPKGARVLADTVERLSDGLRFLPDVKYSGPFVGLTILALIVQIWGMQRLAIGVGLSGLSFAQMTVVTGVLGLGFAMPNAPGFFGSIQLALYAGLAVYVAPQRVVHEGAALVFIYYVLYLLLVVLYTVLGLWMEYRSSGTGEPSVAAAD